MACQAPTSRLDVVISKLNESSDQHPELLSVSSYNSLSSLSSCESDTSANHSAHLNEDSGASQQRSIFKTYWEKSGSHPRAPVVPGNKSSSRSDTTATTVASSESSTESDGTDNTCANYERSLRRNEGIKASRSRRRSIFGDSRGSMPSLPARPYNAAPLERRAKSTSELEKGKLPSCLRSRDGQGRVRSSSVSFDNEVSIYEFSPPKENWAADGWSKWFH
jgi:hypothetical protein